MLTGSLAKQINRGLPKQNPSPAAPSGPYHHNGGILRVRMITNRYSSKTWKFHPAVQGSIQASARRLIQDWTRKSTWDASIGIDLGFHRGRDLDVDSADDSSVDSGSQPQTSS